MTALTTEELTAGEHARIKATFEAAGLECVPLEDSGNEFAISLMLDEKMVGVVTAFKRDGDTLLVQGLAEFPALGSDTQAFTVLDWKPLDTAAALIVTNHKVAASMRGWT